MKATIITVCFTFFFCLNLALSGQDTANKKSKSQFFPLKVGNYWIYSYSNYPTLIDTIKITKVKVTGLDTAYVYGSALWLERNDTIYEIQSQKTGYSFRTIQYFPSDKETRFFRFMGGDAIRSRTVKKLNGSYRVNNKEYFNCYEFKEKTENGFDYKIFSYGIGIIETKGPMGIRSLIEYKIE